MQDKLESAWSYRDLVVALPILGSAIAISYDVGYFFAIDINFFTVFSISEHIAFALEVLPIGILASTCIVVAPIAFDMGRAHGSAETLRAQFTGLKIPFYKRKSFWFDLGFSLFLIWNAFRTRSATALAVLVLFVVGTIMAQWSVKYLRRPIVFIGAGSIFALTIAFTLGIDIADGYRHTPEFPYTIRSGGSELKGKVIRSGERGVLFFEQSSKQLVLLPWSDISWLSRD